MSGAAGSSAATFAASHRWLILALSTLMLVTSAFINFRRSGGRLNKVLVLAATCAACFVGARSVGVI
jgi:hypothetical protein